MTYLKVIWNHTYDDQPVELFSELDADRMETRKVERYRNGALTFSGPDTSASDSILGETPIPTIDTIAADSEFEPTSITQAEFESIWQSAILAAAA